MNKSHFLHFLLGITVSSTFMCSCISEEINNVEGNSEEINLAAFNEQIVDFKIRYDVPEGYRVAFDVYAENPFEVTTDGFGKKPEVSPIVVAMTDENGEYNIPRVISGGVKEVYVVSNSAGAPALLHGTIQNGTVEPVAVDMETMLDEESGVDSRATFNVTYLGDWNYWGRPNYIDKSKSHNIGNSEMRSISNALPEWQKVKDEYTTADFVLVEKEAEVWISLLSEKSLFSNALGYFCYKEGMSKDNISEIIAFPHTKISLIKNHGLKEGEYIKLKYMNPVTKKLQDKFPAGTRIGWVLHRSGFQNLTSKVNNGTYQFYSKNEWNPERTKKNHTAMFTTNKGNLIIGFEDVHNEALLADGDCNDVIIHVASYPHNAIQAKAEIPNIENDKIEEEVDIIQPLNEIIEVSSNDPLFNDIMVASKSTLTVENNYVVGVKDILYFANKKAMNSLVTKTYTTSEMERKVVVRTTVKFSRAEKKRAVVRTTVKNTSWDVEEATSRALFYYEGNDIEELIEAVIEHYSSKLADGECVKLEVVMTFEPVKYNKFIKNISVPPYSPFIKPIE